MPITVHDDLRIYELQTKQTSYVFGFNDRGILQHLYWGEPIEARDCAHRLLAFHHSSFDAEVEREYEEYSFWGGASYVEPTLKVQFADGVRDLKMNYEGYHVEANDGEDRLILTWKDNRYPLQVRLHYRVIPGLDLIERHAEAVNCGDDPIIIENIQSAAWPIPMLPQYRMTHVTGRWAGEYQLRDTVLSEGKKVIESRRGFTGSHANPWFAIDNGIATESAGSVWFGALGWSGNWKIVAEKTNFNHVRVTGGIHDFDSQWTLQPGETFAAPVFVGGYSASGFGGMSRLVHDYQREYILPKSPLRKVLYNSWEATAFDVNVEEQIELAKRAAKMGVERFVVDDGWFGQRNSDRAGLGDWYVNPEKFPNGLGALIEKVHELGMDFGIWVEPESVNPDSDLYRNHPDWVYRFPTRTGTQLRNQLALNIAKPEVKQYILRFMTDLLSSYPINFIKWDFNRTITEPGMHGFSPEQQKEVWIRHVRSLYDIWSELREKFPHVEFETCAGGGSRIDFGMLRYADQAWPSDNTDAFDRLSIQEGFSYMYCPQIMMCWVTDSPNGLNGRKVPMAFRFRSAMSGSLGIGGNLREWTESEIDEAAQHIQTYKEIRPLVQRGKQYRLASLRHSMTSAVQYVNDDQTESVVLAFLHAQQFAGRLPYLKLQGLARDLVYTVKGIRKDELRLHGSTLMNAGIPLPMRGDFDSLMIRLEAVEE
ncbi:alpha-galactosidase [Paenibacillus montanisoli]|uniref:Alpha-galactosidase n=1 Tax=Paenibacillus montanisoli TaxID=2081970 RepID=A0A328U675_9BACL|nr:alpha-galactosidase [Paenibacillus montanisoli]RAP77263.1 alpha-galactosidase [Paenibacillus montanisoli]